MGKPAYSISLDDIDPSDFTEEELQEIIFNGLFCAKIVEQIGEGQKSLQAAYNVIKHIEDLPHERTPPDALIESTLDMIEE